LVASQQIDSHQINEILGRWEFVGELSLTGTLLPVRGSFALAMGVVNDSMIKRSLVLPLANREEASLTESPRLGFARCLKEVADFLSAGHALTPPDSAQLSNTAKHQSPMVEGKDWSDIRGQASAKRAAVIAAAGRHNLLMFGPPGVGKSMIASRLAALMPKLSHEQACELASIQSLAQGVDLSNWRTPPYRAPHHSTPARAIVGGGQPIRPGEVSLAHHGVLFLDELTEFSRDALESLREPLETDEVSVVRVRERSIFPASILLVAAMNPCPCGYYGAKNLRRVCRCSPDRVQRYREKISGPMLDRFDMAIGLTAVNVDQLSSPELEGLSSSGIRATIERAHRYQGLRQARPNAKLSVSEMAPWVKLDPTGQKMMEQTAKQFGWSARAWHRTLRVARTIADLNEESSIQIKHLAEAIELRRAMDIPEA
jgi:magnesium chelatase family protein